MFKKIKQTLFREKYVFVAFAATWILLMGFACAVKLAPFGDKCLISMDLYGQYYPMMSEKLSDYFSVWSWNGSLGFSSLVQSAYYTNSIFLLIMLPFSGYARVVALHMMIFLKLALASAAFAYYIGKKFGKHDFFTAVFGVAYGLGAYTLAFMNQPMWLDVVLYCPLILCALDRLISGGSPIPYAILLALAIYSNFYISFALCIFLVLWFIVSMVIKKWNGFSDFAKTTLKFSLASVGAGLLCAFMLIPLMLHMENWISSSVGFPEKGEWYHDFSAIADSFSSLNRFSWEYGPANVFCGSATVFMVITYLFNSKISLKKRITMTALAVLLFVSFEWNFLDFIWHGLHFPNQLPGRQSFLFILVVLLIGYETVTRYDGLHWIGVLLALFATAAFFLSGMAESKNVNGRWLSLGMVFGIFVLLAIVLVAKKKPVLSKIARSGLALVLLTDICVNACFVLEQYSRTTFASAYVKNEETMRFYAKKYQSKNDDFWRAEMTRPFTFDAGQLYGFKGISYYSSTMNGATYNLMDKLGNRVYARNVSTIHMPTAFQDMMFGVKYHFMNNARTLSYGTLLESKDGTSVYESRYALPIAYAVEPNIKKIEGASQMGFALQERFIGLAANMKRKLAYKAYALETHISNGDIRDGYMYARDIESPVVHTVEFEVAWDGYFYLEFDYTVGNYEVTVNEGTTRRGSCGEDPLLGLERLRAGDQVKVTVTTRGYGKATCGIHAYTVDKEALSIAHEKLSAEALQVEYASDTEIRGEITLAEDGVLYASIPAENGWEVYIDGEKQETYDLGMGLLFCDIDAGTHQVEYRYRAPGFALGAAISSVTALCMLGFGVFDWMKKKKGGRTNDGECIEADCQ